MDKQTEKVLSEMKQDKEIPKKVGSFLNNDYV